MILGSRKRAGRTLGSCFFFRKSNEAHALCTSNPGLQSVEHLALSLVASSAHIERIMFRITALSAFSLPRTSLLAAPGSCSATRLAKAYTDSAFSVHVPKAAKPRKRSDRNDRAHDVHRSPARQQPGGTRRPGSNSASGSTRKERLLALAPLATDLASLPRTVRAQLDTLQDAIDSQDLASVWTAWERLGPNCQHVGRAQHRDILRLSSALSAGAGHVVQSQQWKTRLGEFANAASMTGDVDLITAWFRLLLAHGQFDAVVAIWQHIVRMRLANAPLHEPKPHTPPATEEQAEESRSFVQLDVSRAGVKIEIHDMVCLIAFAYTYSQSPWRVADLFDTVEFGTPFRIFFQSARAKRLHDSLLPHLETATARAANWEAARATLWDIELARGLSSGSGGAQRIARLLGSLFTLRQVDDVHAIFSTAMRACSQSPPWLLMDHASPAAAATVPAQRVRWTESCWSVCLSNFIAAGRIELAMQVWSKFQALKLRPTPRIWNALLDGYGRANNHAAAVQTWTAALNYASTAASASPPDVQMYTTMINIHLRAKHVEEAMALFADMVAASQRNGGQLNVGAETYNAVLNGLFLNRRHAQAQVLLEDMLAKGPAPNIGTINTFLRAHARLGDLQSVASTIRLADKLRLEPDVVTFTTILDALLRQSGESASTDAVAKSLDIMNSLGVQPNVVTYTAMIKACLVGADAAHTDLASQTLLKDSPDRRTQSSNDVRIEAALELLDRMIDAKVAPSEITYTALINGAMQNPDAVAHAFATKSVPARYRAAPKPLSRLGESVETTKRWTQSSPSVSLALLLLEHMKSRGLPLTSATHRCLIEGLCSASADQAAFFRSMDVIDDMMLRTSPPEPSRALGAFASAALKNSKVRPPMAAPGHTTWIVIFSSLLERLEYGPRDKVAVETAARALHTAIQLVREMGSLAGADGGLSLSRLVERAASRLSHLPQ